MKDFEIGTTEPEQQEQREKLEAARKAWYEQALCVDKAASLCNLPRAEWDNETKQAIVDRFRGKHFDSLGQFVQGKFRLNVEEAVFLLDQGLLEIFYQRMPLAISDGYALLSECDYPLSRFLVFSYLRRLGYIVLRHSDAANQASTETAKPKFSKNVKGVSQALPSTQSRGWWPSNESDDAWQRIEPLKPNAKQLFVVKRLGRMGRCTVYKDDTNMLEAIHTMRHQKKPRFRNATQPAHMAFMPSEGARLEMKQIASNGSNSTNAQIVFDVYKPTAQWKRQNPGQPSFMVVVCEFWDQFPPLDALAELEQRCAPVPLKCCVVSSGEVSFVGFHQNLPQASNNKANAADTAE